MICPKCGHHFLPLPKMSTELEIRVRAVLDQLKTVKDRELKRGELWGFVCNASQDCGSALWSMQGVLIHLKARGVLYHPEGDGKGSVRLRWLVDQQKLKDFWKHFDRYAN